MSKLLVVDDSWLIRNWLSGFLEKAGHNVHTAVNGREALEEIREHEPDCVFLDILMPEMNGLEVLEILKKENMTVPVIVLTADIQTSTHERCMTLGATAILNKPPNEKRVHEYLDEALKNTRGPMT